MAGITKRGDPYLRMLLIHGARSVVYWAPGKLDRRSVWVTEKRRTKGTAKACVAVAKKNARIICALLSRGESIAGLSRSSHKILSADCKDDMVMAKR